jgi:hypothetical protein
MNSWIGVGLLIGVTACVASQDGTGPNQGDASTDLSGSGGAPADGCTPDRSRGDGGAVFEIPGTPPAGASCPVPGIEYCEHVGGEPSTALFRCTESGWQRVQGAICTPDDSTPRNCHIWPPRDLDGECCFGVRHCGEAFCDGTRWWTNR